MRSHTVLWLDVGVKAATGALLGLALLAADLPQSQGNAFAGRAWTAPP